MKKRKVQGLEEEGFAEEVSIQKFCDEIKELGERQTFLLDSNSKLI